MISIIIIYAIQLIIFHYNININIETPFKLNYYKDKRKSSRSVTTPNWTRCNIGSCMLGPVLQYWIGYLLV